VHKRTAYNGQSKLWHSHAREEGVGFHPRAELDEDVPLVKEGDAYIAGGEHTQQQGLAHWLS